MPRSDLRSARRYMYTSRAASTSEVLKLAVLNGYIDHSKDTWIRSGVDAAQTTDSELHLGLCNPFLLSSVAAGEFAGCIEAGCTCPPPPDGIVWDGIYYDPINDKCICFDVQGTPPLTATYTEDAINCNTDPPPITTYKRSPTRSMLFFRLIDSLVAYDAAVNINSRLPTGIDPSKILSAKLILTVKTSNEWFGAGITP